MQDVRKRVKSGCQLTTDGFIPYLPAVNAAFGQDIHFAQQTKVYAQSIPMPKRIRHELKTARRDGSQNQNPHWQPRPSINQHQPR